MRRLHPITTLAVGLFALALGVYLLALRVDFGYDGQMMFRVTESLALRHSFRVVDPVWHANEPYAYFGLGVSLAMLPLFWLGRLVANDGSRLIAIYGPLITAATVLALFHLLKDLGASLRTSVALAIVYAFSTLAWHDGTAIFSEPLIALTLTCALLWLRRYRGDGRRRWLAAAGVAVAVSLLARWDSLLLVVAPLSGYALYHLWNREAMLSARVQALLAYGAPIAAGLSINLWYDWLRYASVFSVGPPRALEGGFSTPLLTGLYGLLLSPGAGLLVYVPVLAVSALAARGFWQRHRAETALVVSLLALRLLFYARWGFWDGRDWGPRFLVPLLPLLILPLVFLPARRWLRGATVVLAAAGFAIELLGQVVPYDTIVWPQTAPVVVSTLGLHDPSGSTCLCSWEVDHAAATAMDFQPRFAPLVRQVESIRSGAIDPEWKSWWPVLLPLLGFAAVVALQLWRLAARLDLIQEESERAAGLPESARYTVPEPGAPE